MKTITIPAFQLIGMSIITSNQDNESAQAIPALWGKFMASDAVKKIPNKLSEDIYCVYTHYDGDHTQPYTTFLGCKVAALEDIPEGMEGLQIAESQSVAFQAQGNLSEGAVWNKWVEIWEAPLERAYSADFEVYGELAQDPTNATVDIFVAVQ